MNIGQVIKNKVLRMLGVIRLNGDPKAERYTYINDEEAIRLSNVRANRIWYLGDGDELLNWYTNQRIYGWAKNVIYNRNKRRYFWGESVDEIVKRIHSGVPKAIIETTSNAVGMPTITCDLQEQWDAIAAANDFDFMLTQRSRPMVLAEGDGAWKINIDPALSDKPLVEYYGAEDWEPIRKSNVLVGMVYKSYYKDKDGKDHVLMETRTIRPEGLAIEYRLFKLCESNDVIPEKISVIPELSGLKDNLIQGMRKLLGVPIKYYFDPLHPNRGRSIYDGKLDLFDFLDEILTQAGQTNRVSTPVEYYPVDLLSRAQNGQTVRPNLYNRQYVEVEATPDGDGNMSNKIQTTQPELNFDRYAQLFSDTLGTVLIGVLSPSSLGIDIAKKDNAEAQREKEKQTIFTRNTIIKNETKAVRELVSQCLMAQEYMDSGVFRERKYEIGVKYDEFANPSFESELQALGPAWAAGQISTERYVSLLWAGKMSDEEMAAEVAWLDENRKKDDFDINALMEHENEKEAGEDIPGEGQEEKALAVPEE